MTESLEAALTRAAPDIPPDLRKEIAAHSRRVNVRDGYRIFGPGDRTEHYLIPLTGAVRVEQMGPSGRSVVLYRVSPGDSCVMTASCIMSGLSYGAYGYAEGDVEALAMPAADFRSLVESRPEFRQMALKTFAQRIIELTEVIDELLLHRVDLRLAGWLAERGAQGVPIASTHQSIAGELGTAREVVSRILKEFERRGWVELARGEVRVLDADSLRSFAATR